MPAIYKVARTVAKHPGVYRSAVNTNPVQAPRGFAPSRRYRVGHATQAHPDSLGIFCFDDYMNAADFAKKTTNVILLVEGIGERLVPFRMDQVTTYPLFRPIWISGAIPRGTVCYPAVKVLSVYGYRGTATGGRQ